MKKCLITAHLSFLLCISGIGLCQSADQRVTVSAGNDIAISNVQLTWTLGQFVGFTSVSSNIHLTEGFLQTNPITVLSSLPEIDQRITIFPNPTTDFVNIESATKGGTGSYQLANMDGKIVKIGTSLDFTIKQEIPMHLFADGIYLLTIKMNGQPSKQFKIIKK